jgi:hypothetical protein
MFEHVVQDLEEFSQYGLVHAAGKFHAQDIAGVVDICLGLEMVRDGTGGLRV